MNSYELSRNFWNWAFDNPEKISPNHAAIYFFAMEHCNRLGWKTKFGFPSQMTMDAVGIKKHSTYIRYFNDLIEYGFFNLIQKSSNQYSSNIISLSIALPKKGEALDKAMVNHGAKQSESIGQSKRSIDKQINKEQINNKQEKYTPITKIKNSMTEREIIGTVKPTHLAPFFLWLEYKNELKDPYKTELGLKKIVKEFNKHTVECCDWVVNQSISNEWKGLFWDKYTEQKKTSGNPENITSYINQVL